MRLRLSLADSGALATAVGFIPGIGDAYDIVSALAGKDLLTGESISTVGVGAPLGTFFGSGKFACEGLDAASAAYCNW
jgi:hypothetical protein